MTTKPKPRKPITPEDVFIAELNNPKTLADLEREAEKDAMEQDVPEHTPYLSEVKDLLRARRARHFQELELRRKIAIGHGGLSMYDTAFLEGHIAELDELLNEGVGTSAPKTCKNCPHEVKQYGLFRVERKHWHKGYRKICGWEGCKCDKPEPRD